LDEPVFDDAELAAPFDGAAGGVDFEGGLGFGAL
jgi:hypothetical protein